MTAVLTYYEAAEFGSIVQLEVSRDLGSFVVTRQGKRRHELENAEADLQRMERMRESQ